MSSLRLAYDLTEHRAGDVMHTALPRRRHPSCRAGERAIAAAFGQGGDSGMLLLDPPTLSSWTAGSMRCHRQMSKIIKVHAPRRERPSTGPRQLRRALAVMAIRAAADRIKIRRSSHGDRQPAGSRSRGLRRVREGSGCATLGPPRGSDGPTCTAVYQRQRPAWGGPVRHQGLWHCTNSGTVRGAVDMRWDDRARWPAALGWPAPRAHGGDGEIRRTG